MYCPHCGVSNPAGAAYCRACGKPMPTITTSVKCPYCGADGQEYQLNCTKCGKELPRGMKIEPVSGATTVPAPGVAGPKSEYSPPSPPGQPVTAKPCPICGRPMSIYAERCEYCSRPEVDYSQYSTSDYHVSQTDMPSIGGVLILLSGILGVFFGLLTMVGGSICCSGLFTIFGLIAIAGSFSAMGRKSGVFAIIGGVFGILSIGFFIGALLALIGIILVAISYNEFEE